jgi:hypothetical protein
MTPYFVSANQKNILNRKEEPIQIYINNQQDISKITSNKDINGKVNKLYITVILIIFAFAILFFIIRRKGVNNSFVNGLFGAGALLILPILWVFNYTIGIRIAGDIKEISELFSLCVPSLWDFEYQKEAFDKVKSIWDKKVN